MEKLTVLIFTLAISFCLQSSNAQINGDEIGRSFEGDIALSKDQDVMFSNRDVIEIKPAKRWPARTIPFKISPKMRLDQIRVILGGMREIMDETCITFKARKREEDYIYIQLGASCVSNVGRKGGKQNVTLRYSRNPTSNCVKHGEVLHELLHAIGLWHEQSRPDRDQYVKIEYQNLSKHANKNNFKKHLGMRYLQTPYDFSSIMHYSKDAFQKNPSAITVVTKIRGAVVGPRFHMSHFDKVKVNRLYECDAFH